MNPALGSLYGNSTRAILDFGKSVVDTGADNNLFGADNGVSDILTETEADTTAAACLDKIVLGTGIEGVLAVNEFGVENYISLLRRF